MLSLNKLKTCRKIDKFGGSPCSPQSRRRTKCATFSDQQVLGSCLFRLYAPCLYITFHFPGIPGFPGNEFRFPVSREMKFGREMKSLTGSPLSSSHPAPGLTKIKDIGCCFGFSFFCSKQKYTGIPVCFFV